MRSIEETAAVKRAKKQAKKQAKKAARDGARRMADPRDEATPANIKSE